MSAHVKQSIQSIDEEATPTSRSVSIKKVADLAPSKSTSLMGIDARVTPTTWHRYQHVASRQVAMSSHHRRTQHTTQKTLWPRKKFHESALLTTVIFCHTIHNIT
jgi:hypothetical protein